MGELVRRAEPVESWPMKLLDPPQRCAPGRPRRRLPARDKLGWGAPRWRETKSINRPRPASELGQSSFPTD